LAPSRLDVRSIEITVGCGVPLDLMTNAITVAVPISVAMRNMMDIKLSAKTGNGGYFGRLRLTRHSRREGGSRLGK
jgi:hypothetical protein